MPSLDERRDFPRAYLNCHLELCRRGERAHARVADISERGACLRDAPDLPFDEEVELTIPLLRRDGKSAACRVVGHVVRRDRESLGVHFLPVQAADMLRLRDFIWRNRIC